MRTTPATLLRASLLACALLACGDKAPADDSGATDDTGTTACVGDEGTLTVSIVATSQWIAIDGARAFVRMPAGDELEGIADAEGVVAFTLDAGDHGVRAEGAPGDLTAQSDPVDARVVACEDTPVRVPIYEVDG